MTREHFVKVVEAALDSLPRESRSRIRNVAVLVEDMPPNQHITAVGAAKGAASGSLPWRAHNQEEHICPTDGSRLHRALSEEY
jgi:hypothetical protein